MTPDEFFDAIRDHDLRATNGPWYVQPNDLIGGFCIRDENLPPSSSKGRTLADVTYPDDAQFIVMARDALFPLTEALAEIVQLCEIAELEVGGAVSFVETEALKNAIERWMG